MLIKYTSNERKRLNSCNYMCVGVPVVAASPEIVSVSVGEEVNLPCPAFGRPLVIKWLKEGNELGKGSRHEVTDNGTLTILRTKTSDSGIYLCVVSNPFGNTTKTTQLIAKSKQFA